MEGLKVLLSLVGGMEWTSMDKREVEVEMDEWGWMTPTKYLPTYLSTDLLPTPSLLLNQERRSEQTNRNTATPVAVTL